MMDRRTFLAAPLVFGWHERFAQDLSPKLTWLADAYAQMKNEDLRGIAVVVPDAAPDRAALGRALWQRIQHGGPSAQALFLQSVFIFMTEPLARQHLGETLRPWHRVVLAPDGARIQVDRVALETFRDPKEFESSMAPPVFGESLAILSDREEKAWALASADEREALDQLGHDDLFVRKRAMDRVRGNVHALLPCLMSRGRVHDAARDLIETHYRYVLTFDTDPRMVSASKRMRELTGQASRRQLPYGTALPGRILGGCGISVEEPPEGEPLPKKDQDRINTTSGALCGMARMDSVSYSFVKFLTK